MKRNILNGVDDSADPGRGLVNIPGSRSQLFHLCIGLGRIAGGPVHQIAGTAAAHSAGLNLGGNGRHIRHKPVNRSGLFRCSLGQFLGTGGYPFRTGMHLSGHLRNIADDVHQIGVNRLEACGQSLKVANIISFIGRNVNSQIAVGHLPQDAPHIINRLSQTAADPMGGLGNHTNLI